ncbi:MULTISPECIES: hypothetical protein [Sediminimonas]|uniref:hypothetical protein n=1 Tax=Sediminimonas TaxID=659427 RepID=UPI00041D0471|nr:MULTISPECIES: hypothetical protein [Sediminimonas]MDR9485375.1 hypothetical protein [Sediminimonas sp.]
MYITQINIAESTPSAPGQPWQGLVALFSGNRCVNLSCSASEPDPANRRTAFVAEALRQLRRMPEYRTGRRRIDVAPGLGAPTGA